MVKFVPCKCPNCGSNLKVDEKLEKTTCKYCGGDIIIERDMDYELKKTLNKSLKTGGKIFTGVSIVSSIIFIIVFGIALTFFIFVFKNIYNEVTGNSPTSFNFLLKDDNGSKLGLFVKNTLDTVITSNKENKKHIIYVKYNDIYTKKEKEIISIKQSLVDNVTYEVIIDYDDAGFINKITIEDIN